MLALCLQICPNFEFMPSKQPSVLPMQCAQYLVKWLSGSTAKVTNIISLYSRRHYYYIFQDNGFMPSNLSVPRSGCSTVVSCEVGSTFYYQRQFNRILEGSLDIISFECIIIIFSIQRLHAFKSTICPMQWVQYLVKWIYYQSNSYHRHWAGVMVLCVTPAACCW